MGMLTLTRRPGESIIVEDLASGEVLRLVVLERDHGHTKLGIEATRRYDIWREEVWLERQRRRRELRAAGGAG